MCKFYLAQSFDFRSFRSIPCNSPGLAMCEALALARENDTQPPPIRPVRAG